MRCAEAYWRATHPALLRLSSKSMHPLSQREHQTAKEWPWHIHKRGATPTEINVHNHTLIEWEPIREGAKSLRPVLLATKTASSTLQLALGVKKKFSSGN